MAIAVLISGGVDSAVVVHRLVEQGEDLHLFYIRIGLDIDEGDCSADEDIEMCTLIARKYGLPFDVVSLHEEYWDNVMEYALRTVKAGLTPNPDMMCNRMIKFGYFEQRWGKEFDLTATGHYATTDIIDGRKYLATAIDPVKDQTDFLAQITQEQLNHLIFPIGNLPKEEVRRIAQEVRLPNASRKDSQGICFLGQINYNDFIRRYLGERRGPIIEIETGRKLGEHRGYWFHTIGQRKGLGLSGGPWYVVKKNVEENIIYVSGGYGTEKQYGRTLHLDEMHFIGGCPWDDVTSLVKVTFKNRHTPVFMNANFTRISDREWLLESESDVQGIAPGQYAVIYDENRHLCFGSGMIVGSK
ncbi:MAG: tRNA 2-thiouridine(34) synthase MnmA [Muribaculaceae bacterium]|nr:tRNA 2-thiouridine(34) synthase MnmA [Muribaculaceae bacterium]